MIHLWPQQSTFEHQWNGCENGGRNWGWEEKQLALLEKFGASIYWKIPPSMSHSVILSHRGRGMTGQGRTGEKAGRRQGDNVSIIWKLCGKYRLFAVRVTKRKNIFFPSFPFHFLPISFHFLPCRHSKMHKKQATHFVQYVNLFSRALFPAVSSYCTKQAAYFVQYNHTRQAAPPRQNTFSSLYTYKTKKPFSRFAPFAFLPRFRIMIHKPPTGGGKIRQAQAERKAQAHGTSHGQAPRGGKGNHEILLYH